MVTVKGEKRTTTSVMRVISDERSLIIFQLIAKASEKTTTNPNNAVNAQLLVSKINLTRKQFYSRMSKLVSSGLVRRSCGNYELTSLGKIAYDVSALIDQAIQNHWKLKAIDALKSRSRSDILDEERERIIDALLENNRLKQILYSGL